MKTIISDDQVYRYTLVREVNELGTGACLFIMLNPSKADATLNDQTIRRDIGYARGWGFKYLWVANLFAYRATNPDALLTAKNPIGPDNDHYIMKLASEADLVVCAWGAHRMAVIRGNQVKNMLEAASIPKYHMGMTKKADLPRHPLRLRLDQQLWRW